MSSENYNRFHRSLNFGRKAELGQLIANSAADPQLSNVAHQVPSGARPFDWEPQNGDAIMRSSTNYNGPSHKC